MKGFILNWAKKTWIAVRGSILWLKINFPFLILPLVIILLAWIMGKSLLYILFIVYFGLIFIVAEMFNYSIERLCNLIDKKYNKEIKTIKDISAGAVFVSGMALIIVGLYIALH